MVGFESPRSQELVDTTPEAVTTRGVVIGDAVDCITEVLCRQFPRLDETLITAQIVNSPHYSEVPDQLSDATARVAQAYDNVTNGDFAFAE